MDKKSNTKLIVIAAVAITAAVCMGIFLVITLLSKNNTPATVETTQQITETVSTEAPTTEEAVTEAETTEATTAPPAETKSDNSGSIGKRVDFTFFSIEVPKGMVYDENDETGAVTFYDDYNYNLYDEYHMGMVFSIMPCAKEKEIRQMPRAKRLGKAKGYYIAAILPTDVQWDPSDSKSTKSYKSLYNNYEKILKTIKLAK